MTKEKSLTLLAKIVSRIFGFGMFIFLPFVAIGSGRFESKDILWVVVAAAIYMLAGVILFIFAKKGIVSDLDLTDRRERPLYYFILMLLNFILLFVYVVFEVSMTLRYLMLIFLVELIFNFVITLFWKISNHTLWNTSFIVISIIFLGADFYFLLLIIPVVGWARYYLKKHTLAQLLGGFLLALTVILPLSVIFEFL